MILTDHIANWIILRVTAKSVEAKSWFLLLVYLFNYLTFGEPSRVTGLVDILNCLMQAEGCKLRASREIKSWSNLRSESKLFKVIKEL